YCRCFFRRSAPGHGASHPSARLHASSCRVAAAEAANLLRVMMMKKKGMPGDDDFNAIPDDELDEFGDDEEEDDDELYEDEEFDEEEDFGDDLDDESVDDDEDIDEDEE